MTTWIRIGRFHLTQRLNYLVLPVSVLAIGFVVDTVILKLTPAGNAPHRWVGGLGSIYVLVLVLGFQSVARSLPFAMTLGVSRRTYYLSTAVLGLAFATVWGLLIAIGQAAERGTGGWGFKMGYFRVPYILDGPWYLTWLTAAVCLALLFVYGTWFGLVYRRWGLYGAVSFAAAQLAVLAVGAALTTWTGSWPSLGHFFTTVSAGGLTGLLAALAMVLVGGGLLTIRRITV